MTVSGFQVLLAGNIFQSGLSYFIREVKKQHFKINFLKTSYRFTLWYLSYSVRKDKQVLIIKLQKESRITLSEFVHVILINTKNDAC